GANTNVQFNNSGSFGGDANLSWDSTAAVLTIGNGSVNTVLNSTSFSSNASTNGHLMFPGGLILNWGWVKAGTAGATATFEKSYTTNAFSVVSVANASVTVNIPSWTATGANIVTT